MNGHKSTNKKYHPQANVVGKLDDSILLSSSWKNTNSFKSMKYKDTQTKYYKTNNASPEVLQLVDLGSKSFGTQSEKILSEIFHINPRSSCQNDGIFNNRKIEIKSARYWGGKDECKWQHLEPDYDYDYVLFALLDFNGWKVWCMKKDLLMGKMRDKKILTYQGKQGWWVKKSCILPYLTPIKSYDDLENFII